MKVTVFSDVHGNLPALEILLKAETTSDKYIFLGDAVNYAPWSNECVERIANITNCIKILGNHDEAFIKGEYDGTNEVAITFFKENMSTFSQQEKLLQYKTSHQFNSHTCIHTILNKYIYPDTQVDLNENYFVGHSHHQFQILNNGFNLYNPGSVGQNRKFINVISYLNWYPLESKIEFRNITYNIDLVIDKMIALNYPEICMNYYKSKNRV